MNFVSCRLSAESTQSGDFSHEAEIIYMHTNKYLSIIDIFYK